MKTKSRTIVDKDFPDYTLYPIEDEIRDNITFSSPLPNTYYRVDNETLKVKCMVTILEDGWHIAWDTCSQCANHFRVCECKSGMVQPRSITYFYHKARNKVLGEPMISTTELYKGVKPTFRKKYTFKRSEPVASTTVTKPTYIPPVSPRKGEDDGMSIQDIDNIDMSTLNKTAERMAKKITTRKRKQG